MRPQQLIEISSRTPVTMVVCIWLGIETKNSTVLPRGDLTICISTHATGAVWEAELEVLAEETLKRANR